MSPVNQMGGGGGAMYSMADLLKPFMQHIPSETRIKYSKENQIDLCDAIVKKTNSTGLSSPKQIKLSVCDITQCREVILEISTFTKVIALKAMLEIELGVPSDVQCLFDKTHQFEIDSFTLRDYGILEDSSVWMLGPYVKLFIKMPQVKAFLHPFHVYNFKTISDVKRMIGKSMGIPMEKQVVMYEGRSLSDGQTLKDSGVRMNSTLYVLFNSESVAEGFQVIINVPFGDAFKGDVNSSTTGLFIKTMVESKTGFPIGLQELFHMDVEIKDWRHLGDYNVGYGSVLEINVINSPIAIFINTSRGESVSDTLLYNTNKSHKVDNLLSMIPYEVKCIDGYPSLFLDETRLEENKTLAHYNITSGAFLCLDRVIQIAVTIPSEDIIMVDLKPSYSIIKVKEKIKEKCGIPIEIQTLSYLQDEIDEDCTLQDYEDHLKSLWDLRWLCGGLSFSFYMPSYARSCP